MKEQETKQSKPKVGTFRRKQHALFFAVVYVTPFVAMYLWAAYGLVIAKFPFWTLLGGVVGICLTWGACLAVYRKAQPYLQMWRIGRLERAHTEPNTKVPSRAGKG